MRSRLLSLMAILALCGLSASCGGNDRTGNMGEGDGAEETNTLERTASEKIEFSRLNLETFRAAVQIAAARDEQGRLPAHPDSLVAWRFLREIPLLAISGSRRVIVGPLPKRPGSKSGDWYYDPRTGEVRVGIEGPSGSGVPITLFIEETTTNVSPWDDWQ